MIIFFITWIINWKQLKVPIKILRSSDVLLYLTNRWKPKDVQVTIL